MAFKAHSFHLAFFITCYSSIVLGGDKNICDDLIDTKSSASVIKSCLESQEPGFGPSSHYIENEKRKKREEEIKAEDAKEQAKIDALDANIRASEAAEEAKKGANIEFKTFAANDLEGKTILGMPFYAKKISYKSGRIDGQKVLTEGDDLCKYLGYDRAIKSLISKDIGPHSSNNKGLMIKKEYRLFRDSIYKPALFIEDTENVDYVVQKYEEITCGRIISKDIEGTDEILKNIPTDLMSINKNFLNPEKEYDDLEQNDGRTRHKKNVGPPEPEKESPPSAEYKRSKRY